MHRVMVGGRSVRFHEAGSGEAVILVAGLGLTGRFYEASYGPFARAGLRLIVPDLPGFGGTRGPIGGFGPLDAAGFIHEFAAAIGCARAGFVGHSLGWQAAAILAVEQPPLVAALVAAAPTVPMPGSRGLRQLARFGLAALRVDASVAFGVARDYLRIAPPQYIGTWLRHAQDDPIARAAAIRCPFLIVHGTRDPMATAAELERLAASVPDASVVTVPDGTHGLPRQNPAAFNAAATRFLRRALLP